jgi:hypothetical protein
VPSPSSDELVPASQLNSLKMAKYAWKWIKTSDSKYREFFTAKVKRLAARDRSRTMAKRLKGTTTKVVF